MDETRETKEIELKFSKKKVVIKTYLTEKENRELIKNLSKKEVKMVDGKIEESDNATTEELLNYKDSIINVWVLEFDGSKEKINERLMELRREDYNQVIYEVNQINQLEQKKTK